MKINPRQLMVIDGMGALLSAFLLGVILTQFESVFGMPRKELYILASLPCIFAVYDAVCVWVNPKNWKGVLQIIALANLGYCGLSIGFVVANFTQLTGLGMAYFIGEIAIIIALVFVEWKTARRISHVK